MSCILLIACGVKADSNAQTLGHEIPPASENSADSTPGMAQRSAEGTESKNEASSDPENSNFYYPLSKYRKYPEEVQSLIRRADIENGRCRGIFDNETLRACNRRELIMIELEKKGWCWGGADVGYLEHWLKCADDPYRTRE